jgi:hypothetical protein
MTDPETIDVWMIEVLGDGTGNRHQRYLVAAPHREAAIAALRKYTGIDLLVTSCNLAAGEVRPV